MCMEISSIIKWSKRELKSGKGVICEMTRTVPTLIEKDIIWNAVHVERINLAMVNVKCPVFLYIRCCLCPVKHLHLVCYFAPFERNYILEKLFLSIESGCIHWGRAVARIWWCRMIHDTICKAIYHLIGQCSLCFHWLYVFTSSCLSSCCYTAVEKSNGWWCSILKHCYLAVGGIRKEIWLWYHLVLNKISV